MSESNANGRPNGHEKFVGTIAGQKFDVSVRDLLSLLLLVGVFVLGWIIWQQLSFGLRLLHGQHETLEKKLEQQNVLLREQTQEMTNLFYAIDYNQDRPQEQRIPLRLYQMESVRSPTTPSPRGPLLPP